MDERSGLRQSCGRVCQRVTMDAFVAGIAFKAAGFRVDTPHPQLGRVEGELQALIAILECRLFLLSLGEQSGEHQRAY